MRFQPVFLIGNKRSGTSHLTRLINLHPRAFISHESDVIWILYQWLQRQRFACYPWDGPLGMASTVAACRHLLAGDPAARAVADLFVDIELHLMRTGSRVQHAQPYKRDVAVIGDKKPVQQADPAIQTFLQSHFPNARYLHIVRHPRAVVTSMLKAQTWAMVAYWSRGSTTSLLERWAVHEEWVLAIKARHPVLTVRFEDLTASPATEMRRVFTYLGLPWSATLAAAVKALTVSRPRVQPPDVPSSGDRVQHLMREYDYRW
jgi:hypothetical protein